MAGLVALVLAAMFASVAFYINLAEHPGRSEISSRYALSQWRVSYQRGRILQGGLALVGGALGLLAWWTTGERLWILGGVLLLANWPYSLIVIGPVNRKLRKFRDINDLTLPRLLKRWNNLHTVRTLLGIAATLTMFVAIADAMH